MRRDDERGALAAVVSTTEPALIVKAIETLSADAIGQRLFTITRFDSKRGEFEPNSGAPAR